MTLKVQQPRNDMSETITQPNKRNTKNTQSLFQQLYNIRGQQRLEVAS